MLGLRLCREGSIWLWREAGGVRNIEGVSARRCRVRGSWLRADRPDADVWLSPMGSGGTGAVGAPVGRVRRDASDGAVVTCVDRRRPLR